MRGIEATMTIVATVPSHRRRTLVLAACLDAAELLEHLGRGTELHLRGDYHLADRGRGSAHAMKASNSTRGFAARSSRARHSATGGETVMHAHLLERVSLLRCVA